MNIYVIIYLILFFFKIQKEEINKLVSDYLNQQNYRHTLYEFKNEAAISQSNSNYSLINLINKAETEAIYERYLLGIKPNPINQPQQQHQYQKLEFDVQNDSQYKYNLKTIKIQNQFTLCVEKYDIKKKLYDIDFYTYNPIIQVLQYQSSLNDIEKFKYLDKYLYYYKNEIITQFSLDQFEQNGNIKQQTKQLFVNQDRIVVDYNILNSQLQLDKSINYIQDGLLLGATNQFYIKQQQGEIYIYFFDHKHVFINIQEITDNINNIKCFCEYDNSFLLYDNDYIYKFQIVDYIPVLTWKLEITVKNIQIFSKYTILVNNMIIDYDNGQPLCYLDQFIRESFKIDQNKQINIKEITHLEDSTYIFFNQQILILNEETINSIILDQNILCGTTDIDENNIFVIFQDKILIFNKCKY